MAGALAGGAAVTYLLEEDAPLSWRLCAGAAVGLALLGLSGFVLASVFGLDRSAVAGAAIVSAAPVVLLSRPRVRARLRAEVRLARQAVALPRARPSGRLVVTAAVYVLAVLAAVRVADRAFFVRDGDIHVGIDHNLGDLPFHLGVVSGFTRGESFPPEHPELAGVRLTYPFLADFVSALLVEAGAGLRAAFFIPTVVLLVALFGVLHRFGSRLTGDWRAGLMTPVVFLLAGGLGFTMLLREADPGRGGLLGLLRALPHDYTILFSGGLRWGNVVTTMLIPQRSILLGLPLAVVSLTLVWDGLHAEGRRRWTAAGALCGLMPLAHAHSLVVTVSIASAAALLFRRGRAGLTFLLLAVLLSAPQAAWMAGGSALRADSFLGWQPGWDRGEMEPVPFWLLNTGVYWPLILAGLVAACDRRRRLFYLPFALCFVVPNLLRLSPWIWDNIKFLVFWHLGSVPVAALALVRLAERGPRRLVLAGGLLAVLILSGALDLWRVVSGTVSVRVFDARQIRFAESVAAATPPRSVIANAPTYNSPAFLTGRPSLLGYPGHIWSQGMPGGRREQEVAEFYGGGPRAEAVAARYGIDYAVLGPQERDLLAVDDAFFARFPVVVQHGPYRLLRIGNVARPAEPM